MNDPTPTTKTDRLPTRFWKGFVGIALMRVETRLIGLVLAGAIVFAGGAFLFQRQETASARQRSADNEAALDREYEDAVREHQRNQDLYDKCLVDAQTRVDVREALRTQFFNNAENLKTAVLEILPDSDQALTAMNTYVRLTHESVDATYGSYDLAVERSKCVEPGPAPIDPTP